MRPLLWALLALVSLGVLPDVSRGAGVGVCELSAHDSQIVSVQALASGVERRTDRQSGREYTVFQLADGGCSVTVSYDAGHLQLADGMIVEVTGTYYQVLHRGQHTFHNEIEASVVRPLPE